MSDAPTDKNLSERFAAEAKTVNAAIRLLRHIGGAPPPHVAISADGEIGLSWVAGKDRLEMMVQPEDERIVWCVKAGDAYPEHLQGDEPWTVDGVKKVGLSVANFWEGSDRAAESHPSAIREAVEACAKIVREFPLNIDFDKLAPDSDAVAQAVADRDAEIAAAIRAREEEKGNA